MRIGLTALSVALAIAAAIYAVTAPVYAAYGPDGTPIRHATLIQANGEQVLIPAFFPILIAALPLIYRRQAVRIVTALVLLAFSLIAGMSIGMYYAPAGVVMLLAGGFSDPERLHP